jgi:hypothetical protein
MPETDGTISRVQALIGQVSAFLYFAILLIKINGEQALIGQVSATAADTVFHGHVLPPGTCYSLSNLPSILGNYHKSSKHIATT